MNFSYFLEPVWFQSLTALAFGDPEACILVFSFSSFHLPPLGALQPSQLPFSLHPSPHKDTPLTSHMAPAVRASHYSLIPFCPHVSSSLQQDRVTPSRSRLPLPFCPQDSPVCKGLTTTCQVSPSEMSNYQLLSGHTGSCLIIKLFMKLQS